MEVILSIKFCVAVFGVGLLLGCTSTEPVQRTSEQDKAEQIARRYLAENMSSLKVDDSIPEFKEYVDAYEISFLPREARLPQKPNEIWFFVYPTVAVRKSDGKILQAYINQ
jgi:hypothetical protein